MILMGLIWEDDSKPQRSQREGHELEQFSKDKASMSSSASIKT